MPQSFLDQAMIDDRFARGKGTFDGATSVSSPSEPPSEDFPVKPASWLTPFRAKGISSTEDFGVKDVIFDHLHTLLSGRARDVHKFELRDLGVQSIVSSYTGKRSCGNERAQILPSEPGGSIERH